MAAIGENQRKGTRKSEFKVKSGCMTCKYVCFKSPLFTEINRKFTEMRFLFCFRARRVKCDEGKPACKKCSSHGRKCEGYADPFRSHSMFNSQTGRSLLGSSGGRSSASPETDLQISFQSESGLSLDSQDRRCLHYFHQRCIKDLAGLVDTEFWNRYVLRMSTCRPAAQHAILALSAQHEAFLTLSSEQRRLQGDAYSLGHYNKAIKGLYNIVDHGLQNLATIEETLVICLLFIVFEVLHENYPLALKHLEGGLQILSGCDPSAKSVCGHAGEDLSTSALAKAYGRLDIQASTYLGNRNPQPVPAAVSIICSNSPVRKLFDQPNLVFIYIEEARDALNTHIAAVYHFMRSPTQSLQSYPGLSRLRVMDLRYEPLLSRPPNDSLFASLFTEQTIYLAALRRWACSFESFLGQSTSRTSCAKGARPGVAGGEEAVLWISYLVVYITLSTCLEPDESSYDTFQLQFERIVEQAEFILKPYIDGTLAKRKRFSLEMSVIQPLYFTSLKCRDSKVRHRAISLLQMSGQEGVWDGKMLGIVAKYVAEHEERQGCVEVGSSTFRDEKMVIHESARVHGVALNVLDRTNGKVHIEYCMRNFTGESIITAANSTSACNGYEWVWENKVLEP